MQVAAYPIPLMFFRGTFHDYSQDFAFCRSFALSLTLPGRDVRQLRLGGVVNVLLNLHQAKIRSRRLDNFRISGKAYCLAFVFGSHALGASLYSFQMRTAHGSQCTSAKRVIRAE